jgi:hypothetical protein
MRVPLTGFLTGTARAADGRGQEWGRPQEDGLVTIVPY